MSKENDMINQDSFTQSKSFFVGKKFIGECIINVNYEKHLTIGNKYELEIMPFVFKGRHYCCFVSDGGVRLECHLNRFKKIGDVCEKG